MNNGFALTRRQMLLALSSLPLLSSGQVLGAADNKMRGALMILSTPYTDSGEVDYEDLVREVQFCARCGVQGLVWPQNSSEQRYLSKEERIKGFEVLAEANRGTGMVLVLGVQAEDTNGMLEYARIAEELEPDGMIAIQMHFTNEKTNRWVDGGFWRWRNIATRPPTRTWSSSKESPSDIDATGYLGCLTVMTEPPE